jgi:hypothetical protein
VLLVDLADLCARAGALEGLLFEHVGAWTADVDDPWVAAELAEWSRNHAWHVELWTQRFPDVPGLDQDAATAEARGALADSLAGLGEPDARARLTAALAGLTMLEALCEDARHHVDRATDAPTARVLELVLADCRTDIARADSILAGRRPG